MIVELKKNSAEEFEQFAHFFEKYDYLFPDPFSNHVVIQNYCKKLSDCGRCFLYKKNGLIVGIACAYINDYDLKCAFFQVLLVSPDFCGQGIGKTLCQAVLNAAKQSKMKKCQLTVDKSNVTAFSLYKKLGFAAISDPPPHENPQKIYMIKYL